MIAVVIVSITHDAASGYFTVVVRFVKIQNLLATRKGYGHNYQRYNFFHSKAVAEFEGLFEIRLF
jgi:hypothetical protein